MMAKPTPSQFVVRTLRSEVELAACLALDHSYETDFVWQMDVREEPDGLAVRFRTVRLPRTMRVDYPRDAVSLALTWQTRGCFLVAATEDRLLGYVHLGLDPTRTRAWVHDLAVDRPFRRRRIGSALIEQAAHWAKQHQAAHLTVELQTKNYPGILFAQAHRFVFCGFNDHYYTNQDIAVFFGRNL